MRHRPLVASLWAVWATACEASATCDPLDGPPPAWSPDAPGRVVSEPSDEAATLFDPSLLRTVDLELAPKDLEKLDADPAAEAFVSGTFTVDGVRVGPVGVRYKASVGGWVGCIEGSTPDDPFNLTGRKTCAKLSYKIDFAEYDDTLRFFGLKRLNLHAMNADPSMMRERLGYTLFRAMGVPAPRATHVRVRVNGVEQGVFLMVEAIDGRFTAAHFADGDGNLYKETWPTSVLNRTQPLTERRLRDALETHSGPDADVSVALRVGRAIDKARGAEQLQAFVDGFSVEHTARYLAVDRAIANDDGALHYYCQSGGCSNHNFFVYEEERADRLWLIPWDLDLSFATTGPTATDTDRFVSVLDRWDDHDVRCVPHGGDGGDVFAQLPAACDPIVKSMGCAYADPVASAREELLAGPMSDAVVSAELDAWTAQIHDAVIAAHDADPRQPSVDAWTSGVQELVARIARLRSAGGEGSPAPSAP